jgi:hypothetical protein
MSRLVAACAVLLLIISALGCGDSCTSPPSCPADAKAEVAALHVLYLEYFLDGDAQHYVARFAPFAVDLGGRRHGDGSIDARFFTEAYWESVFTSPDFVARFGGKSVDDVVDVSSIRVLTKCEAEEEGRIWWHVDFEMSEGDLYAGIPRVAGSALTDTWFAIYRKTGDTWLVVALD